MAFASKIYPGEIIINDTTVLSDTIKEGASRGLEMPVGRGDGYAYGGVADPFPPELLIPRSEWEARIKEMEETKSRLSDLILQAQLPEKDQNGIPYCWIFGPVQCVEVLRLIQNQAYVSLSPASAGAPIKNFRSEGGWGKEGLAYIVEHGLVPSSIWPDCAIDRKYWTAENKAVALNYRVTEWWELKPRTVEQQFSLLLRRTPGAAGYNWQAHETMQVDPLWVDGAPATRNRNQWKGFGDKNFYILQGSRMLADDLVSPRVAIAS